MEDQNSVCVVHGHDFRQVVWNSLQPYASIPEGVPIFCARCGEARVLFEVRKYGEAPANSESGKPMGEF